MTDYSVDVLNAFERQESDPVITAVKKLIDEHGDLVLKYVKMKQAVHTSDSEERVPHKAVLWPVYQCEHLKSSRRRDAEKA